MTRVAFCLPLVWSIWQYPEYRPNVPACDCYLNAANTEHLWLLTSKSLPCSRCPMVIPYLTITECTRTALLYYTWPALLSLDKRLHYIVFLDCYWSFSCCITADRPLTGYFEPSSHWIILLSWIFDYVHCILDCGCRYSSYSWIISAIVSLECTFCCIILYLSYSSYWNSLYSDTGQVIVLIMFKLLSR